MSSPNKSISILQQSCQDLTGLSHEKKKENLLVLLYEKLVTASVRFQSLFLPPAFQALAKIPACLERRYYSIKEKQNHSDDSRKYIDIVELMTHGVDKIVFTDTHRHHIITKNLACLSTCSGALTCHTAVNNSEIQLVGNQHINLSHFAEHILLGSRIVRVVTSIWQRSTDFVIKRETRRKKKKPNQIGNMTSSTTIIMIYNQIELFIKLFHNGKFQINGNPSEDISILHSAMSYIILQLNEIAKKIFPQLKLSFAIGSLSMNMINYKHRYWFDRPNTCINIEKLAAIIQKHYMCKNYAECKIMLINGKVPIYSVRYNMEKAMLYIKYLTPKILRDEKKTCIIISVSGKINMQGCNDNKQQVQKIFEDVSQKIQAHSNVVIVRIRQ